MTAAEIAKEIRKHGRYKGMDGTKSVYVVSCTACGKEIASSNVPAGTGCSVTRRGTATFWCRECEGRAWDSRIH